jgi:outer membrane autotransporter protein
MDAYLNTDSPATITARLHLLPFVDVSDEVLRILPARLGFATFGAQNGYLAAAQVVTDHLDQKRFAPQNPKNRQMAVRELSTDDFVADASRSKKVRTKSCPPAPCLSEGFFTGWLGAFGEYAHEKAQPEVAPFSFDVGGVVVGADYNCVNEDVLGFGGSYVYTHLSDGADAGNGHINQGFLGIYSLLHAAQLYFNLELWGGYYHTNQVRNMFTDPFPVSSTSKTHGWQLAPHFEMGYEGYLSRVCRAQWFGVGPFLLADWVANWEDDFSEHGAGPLNMRVKGRFCSLFRGETGVRLHETIKYSWGDLVFQEKASYAYQKMFGTGTITASFIGAPTSVTFLTLGTAQNLGVAEFSVLFKPLNRKWPYGNLRYQGEFGSKYQSHQGIAEIGKDF